jgi:UDP-glucose 4-epimerase
MKMNKPILVTGAAGFIGSHTCEYLIKQGYDVVGIDNLRTGKISNLSKIMLNPGFIFFNVDCLNESGIETLFETFKFKRVLHLAALVSVQESFKKPELNFDLNIKTVDIISRICARYQVEKLVFASSAAVYGHRAGTEYPYPLSPYAVAKLTSEHLIKGYSCCYGFEATCLRYFNVYGSRQDPNSPYSGVLSIFKSKYENSEPVTIFGDGEQTRDFIDVRDVARANFIALVNPGGNSSLDVCTGVGTSLNSILKILQGIYPDQPEPIRNSPRHGDILHSIGNPDSMNYEFAFLSKIPLFSGLLDLFDF